MKMRGSPYRSKVPPAIDHFHRPAVGLICDDLESHLRCTTSMPPAKLRSAVCSRRGSQHGAPLRRLARQLPVLRGRRTSERRWMQWPARRQQKGGSEARGWQTRVPLSAPVPMQAARHGRSLTSAAIEPAHPVQIDKRMPTAP